ncbi:reverse transcriptase domain-containing protein [Tanacetum coccineum]
MSRRSASTTAEKATQTTGHRNQSKIQTNDRKAVATTATASRGRRGNDKYTPLTMTPKEILATEGANFPRPPPMRTPEEQRVGNGYCEYHRQKGHTTNECVQLRQLIDKLVKEGRLDHLVKNIKEGKDKQRSGGKKDAPRDKADTIYMINAAGHDIHRMYIDGGASADILYEHCFQRLRPEVKSQLNPATTSLDWLHGRKTGIGSLNADTPFKIFLTHTRGITIQMAKDDEEMTAITQVKKAVPRILKNRRHKPCPEKTKAVIQLPTPRTRKNSSPLTWKIAGLEQFSYSQDQADNSLPLSKTLKKCTEEGRLPVDYRSRRLFTQLKQPIHTSHAIRTPTYGRSKTLAISIMPPKTEQIYQAHPIVLEWVYVTRSNWTSRLVANHVLGEYVAKEDNMIQYLDKTKSLIQGFDRFTIRQVPRGDNKKADALKSRSYVDDPYHRILINGTHPHEQKDARRIRRTAQRFELRNGVLYRRSFLQPWLRCVGPIQADYVLREIHAGSCSMHSGPRSVVARALRSGYYWPTMHRDARDMIKKCNDCQVHRPIPRQPQQELTPITSPWPFHKWGIDIAVSDNGKQFCDNPFKDWCARLSITQRFASVKHPQTNGLVERANRSLGEGIKARLDRHKGRWVEELSHVLWAHRTTIKVSTGDTPFSLVYGTEAVIPAEIGMPTIRTAEVNIATNDDERRIDLDILEERREQAAIREEKAKLQMKGYYDAKVRGVSFRPGDFVYRANDASHAEDTGKLGPKWEGPYEVTEALGKGAYKLRDMDGRELPRTWNICNLKKCYL